MKLAKTIFYFGILNIMLHACKKKNDIIDNGPTTGTITDFDQHIYPTKKIGSQWWMAQNLNVAHYNNGDTILNVPNDSIGLWKNYGDAAVHTSAWCTYQTSEVYDTAKYGKLYNWYVAGNKTKNVCPIGWHVPTNAEWDQLIIYLGNITKAGAGGALKDTSKLYWQGNIGATNSSGFSALPGGFRRYDGIYSYFGTQAWFWSSSEYILPDGSGVNGVNRALYNNNTDAASGSNLKGYGFSIRCIKD